MVSGRYHHAKGLVVGLSPASPRAAHCGLSSTIPNAKTDVIWEPNPNKASF